MLNTKRKKGIAGIIATTLVLLALTWIHVGGVSGVQEWSGNVGHHDWDFFAGTSLMTLRSLEARQIPLWTPYMCGGVPLLADSQVGVLSPLAIFSIAFNPITGSKILFLLIPLIGGINTYLLLRSLKCSYLGSLIGSILFAFGGAFVPRLFVGHLNFAQIIWAPLVLLFFFKATTGHWAHNTIAGLFLGVTILSGGNYPAIIIGAMIATYAIVLAIQQKKIRPIIAAAIIAVFAFGFSAVKVLPGVEYAQHANLRTVGGNASIAPQLLLKGIVTPYKEGKAFPCNKSDGACAHEYIGYIGWLPLFVIALSLPLTLRKPKVLATLISIVVLFVIAVGGFHDLSPWSIMHKVPGLSSTGLSSRFMALLSLHIAILLGIGITALQKRGSLLNTRKNDNIKQESSNTSIAITTAIVVAGVLITINLIRAATPFNNPFTIQQASIDHQVMFTQHLLHEAPELQETLIGTSSMKVSGPPTGNFGILDCYNPSTDNLPKITSTAEKPIPPLNGEEYVVLGGGSAELRSWTPQQISIHTTSENESRLIVNQNYFPGWRASNNKPIKPYDPAILDVSKSRFGLISVEVEKGEYDVVLSYKPRSFRSGLIITITTILTTILIWRRVHGSQKNTHTQTKEKDNQTK